MNSSGVFQPQSSCDSVNSTQNVNNGQGNCLNLFSGGWKQQAKTSDLNEDTSTAQHHVAETNQDGYSVLSVTVQSSQWGILEMAGSTNLGDGARKDNAGAHVTLPEGWGSGGALSCSYKPQLWIKAAPGQHLCVQVTWYPGLGSSLGDLRCLHNTLLLVRGTLLSVPGFSNSAILERSDLEFSLLIKT